MKFPPSLAVSALLLLLLARHAQAALAGPPIASVRELRAISGEEAALKRPVRVRGVVTLVDASPTAFIQDGDAGAFLHLSKTAPELRPGQLVEAEGVTYPGLYVPGVAPDTVRVVGEAPLPAPRPISFEQLASGVFNYEWVEVRGIVRSFRADEDGRGVLTLALGDGRLEVHVTHADADAARFVDARVRLAGLAAGFINDRRQLVAPHLRVGDLSGIQVEERAPDDPFALPVTPVEQLLRFHPEGAPGHRVRVQGIVTHRQPGQAVSLREGARGLLVEVAEAPELQPGDLVDALGFAEMGAFSALLRDGVVRKFGDGPPPAAIFTGAREVLKGTFDADLVAVAAQVVDVLRGASEFTLVLREGEIGFQARLEGAGAEELTSLRPGSRVQLSGIVRATRPEFPTRGFSARQRSFEILLRSPRDVVVTAATPFWSARRLVAALAIIALVALAAFAWAASLRRRVAAQTAVIHDKVRAEAALEERERIAREFHDTLEQELVGLMLRLDAASARVVEPQPRELLEGARRLVQGVQAGALGYLLKSAPRAELLEAIRRVAAGERYLPPELAQRLAQRVAAPDISDREIEVLRLVSAGRSNKEIGVALHIAEDTVKRHVSNILGKLGVNDRAQAATEAIRRGFIHL